MVPNAKQKGPSVTKTRSVVNAIVVQETFKAFVEHAQGRENFKSPQKSSRKIIAGVLFTLQCDMTKFDALIFIIAL